jgi:hypothetical protein
MISGYDAGKVIFLLQSTAEFSLDPLVHHRNAVEVFGMIFLCGPEKAVVFSFNLLHLSQVKKRPVVFKTSYLQRLQPQAATPGTSPKLGHHAVKVGFHEVKFCRDAQS